MINPNLYQDNEELNTQQAAAVANVNRRTIVSWIRAGHLPATKLPGQRGQYRITWCNLYPVLTKSAAPKGD